MQFVEEWVLDRARIRTFLSAADVYAFPSRHEGFAVAPLEAMACGLPIVAADAPGVPDLLACGEACGGIMVPRFLMPPAMQTLAELAPMAWALEGFHAVLLHEGGFAEITAPCGKLLALAALLFAAALLANRRRR